MLHGLPAILDTQAMYFVAQPILDRQGEVFGHELLLRFKNYNNPAELLKIVRHLDLKSALDLHVCEMASQLTSLLDGEECWILNLYAESLRIPDMQTAIYQLANQMAPARLRLHVLEIEQVPDMPHLRKTLAAFHEAHIGVVLDIEQLALPCSQFLPFDLLRMPARPEQSELWQVWLEAAQVRGVPLLAYLVEREDLVYRLSLLGIDYLQGYAVRDDRILELPKIQL